MMDLIIKFVVAVAVYTVYYLARYYVLANLPRIRRWFGKE